MTPRTITAAASALLIVVGLALTGCAPAAPGSDLNGTESSTDGLVPSGTGSTILDSQTVSGTLLPMNHGSGAQDTGAY
jgi:hypothetical protein